MRNDPQFKRKVLLTLEELHHTGKRYDPVPIALLSLVFGARIEEESIQSTGDPCKSNEPFDAMDSVLAWAKRIGLVESGQTHDLQNGVRLTAKGMEYLETKPESVEGANGRKPHSEDVINRVRKLYVEYMHSDEDIRQILFNGTVTADAVRKIRKRNGIER